MTSNDEMQEVDIYRTRVLSVLEGLQKEQAETRESLRLLSEALSLHMKQNIEMVDGITTYIAEQMSYRTFRQSLEENSLGLELEKKRLELTFAQQRLNQLEHEHMEDSQESMNLRLEYEKQKLEIESLKRNLEILHKHSTKDKIPSVKTPAVPPLNTKVRDAVIMTAIGTMTAALVGGVIAFVVFFIRFYITNTP